jgi:Ulp1 family protease
MSRVTYDDSFFGYQSRLHDLDPISYPKSESALQRLLPKNFRPKADVDGAPRPQTGLELLQEFNQVRPSETLSSARERIVELEQLREQDKKESQIQMADMVCRLAELQRLLERERREKNERPELSTLQQKDELIEELRKQLEDLREKPIPKPEDPEPEEAEPTGPKPLTPEEHQLAMDGLAGGNPNEVLCSRFNVDLTRGQLKCLAPRTWLNDEVINFYLKLMQERANLSLDGPKIWFPNSFFWTTLGGQDARTYNYKGVRRWTIKAKVKVFTLDYIIFPMNIGCGTHWSLGVIDVRNKGFRYFDSMSKSLTPMRDFVPFLRRYLDDEHKDKEKSALQGVDDWDLLPPPCEVPQQRNGYDCGVFTCCFADYFSQGLPFVFSQDDMPQMRLRIAARVIRAKEDFFS